ncbi:MAG: hypothetical protein AAF609_05445 [Cyanobacteria bacterium P01_C01_bin.120]
MTPLQAIFEFQRLCPYVTRDEWRVECDQFAVIHIWPPSNQAATEFMRLPGMASQIGQALLALELPCAIVRWPASEQVFYQVQPGGSAFSGVSLASSASVNSDHG